MFRRQSHRAAALRSTSQLRDFRSWVNSIRLLAHWDGFCWLLGVLMSYDSRMSDFETFTVQEVPDDAHILDVRDPYEYDAGHIPGAVNIPLDQLPIRIDELDPDTDYYVICRTGGRSARATPYMEMHGYS